MTYVDLHDVVLLHGKSIYSFCRHLTENAADADDLYQETFLKAAELCHKINKSQNPRAFLIRISAGIWRNSLRKEAGRRKILPFSSLSDGEEAVSPEQPPETALLRGIGAGFGLALMGFALLAAWFEWRERPCHD